MIICKKRMLYNREKVPIKIILDKGFRFAFSSVKKIRIAVSGKDKALTLLRSSKDMGFTIRKKLRMIFLRYSPKNLE